MKQTYEIWQSSDGCEATLTTVEGIEQLRSKGSLEKFKLVCRFEAATYEEARAILNLRMGYGPYDPGSNPSPCPKGCGMMYYPEGSGECPICGKVS